MPIFDWPVSEAATGHSYYLIKKTTLISLRDKRKIGRFRGKRVTRGTGRVDICPFVVVDEGDGTAMRHFSGPQPGIRKRPAVWSLCYVLTVILTESKNVDSTHRNPLLLLLLFGLFLFRPPHCLPSCPVFSIQWGSDRCVSKAVKNVSNIARL